MEVTRTNYHEVLPEIEHAIAESDFVSIDCEFTGLINGPEPKGYDSPSQFYVKLKEGSSQFLIVQFGLCAFKYNDERKSYQQSCYNFYIYPSAMTLAYRDVRFMCQASSLSFLVSSGLDLNKVIREGIPYLSKTEEDYYRSKLVEKQEKRSATDAGNEPQHLMKVSTDDEALVEDTCGKIRKFIETALNDDKLVLGPFNSYIRRVIYSNVLNQFKNQIVFESVSSKTGPTNHGSIIVSLKGDKDQERKREEEKVAQEESEMQAAVGFSYVIRRISESGKLVIGHNMFLDLLHIINQFMFEIPSNYYTFKDIANCCFTNVIDTKYLASCPKFKDINKNTVLTNLLENLKNEPFGLPKIDAPIGTKGYILSDQKHHEAAFDAFITGVCFISMAQFIGGNIQTTNTCLSKDSPFLQKYMNKVFNLRLIDIPFLNLNGKDPEPNRDHVLYLSFFKDWKHSNIIELFSPFGNVQVVWINETSAYVALVNHSQVRLALKKLSNNDSFEIMSYVKYQALLNAARPLPTKSSVKKRKISELTKGCMSRLLGHNNDDDDEVVIRVDSNAEESPRSSKSIGKYLMFLFISVFMQYSTWRNCTFGYAMYLNYTELISIEVFAYILAVLCLLDMLR